MASRPSEICEDRDLKRRYPPKIETAASDDDADGNAYDDVVNAADDDGGNEEG